MLILQAPSESGEKEDTQSNKDLDLGFPEDDEDGNPEGMIGNFIFAGSKKVCNYSFKFLVVVW